MGLLHKYPFCQRLVCFLSLYHTKKNCQAQKRISTPLSNIKYRMTIFVKKARTFSLKSASKAVAVITVLKSAAPLFFILCGMALLLAHPTLAIQSGKRGLTLWFNAVLPALFPFFFLSLLLTKSTVLTKGERFLAPVTEKVFRLPPRVGIIFITALLSGYPVGAKLIETAVSSGELSAEDGRKASAFCIVSGPLFLMGTVGLSMFQSLAAGRILLLSHLLSAIAVGILTGIIPFRLPQKESAQPQAGNAQKTPTRAVENVPRIVENTPKPSESAVYEATISLLTMGGTITLFTVFLDLAVAAGIFAFALAPLRLILGESDLLFAAVMGAVEVTRGCEEVARLGVFPLSVATACALLSFGGFSVLMQAKIFLARAQISVKTCIFGKGLQAIIAFLLAYVLSLFFL